MAKKKDFFVCISCGSEFSKWFGKCPACDEWDSIAEAEKSQRGLKSKKPEAVPLSTVEEKDLKRIETGLSEFNIVCGGGVVPGSVILIGGEPGIGKSTLAVQIAGNFNTLYVSGEESLIQIRRRADRIGVDIGKIDILTCTDVDEIIDIFASPDSMKEEQRCLIIDSIQTVYLSEIPGIKGSVSQIRESSSRLASMAKRTNTPVIIIGHITKDGTIAGPKLLEHIVDTVLYFEGDFLKDFRILRTFKNRYGSVNEVGLFRMTGSGLKEVKDKNKVFLNSFSSSTAGNAVSAALEGSRTILFEVQSLVTFTGFSNPRRMSDGFDLNRLILLIAVLEKHAGLKLGSFDVFINVSGGFRINETSADLAVAMAIASSLKDKAVPERTGMIGEISLSGEIRPVSQCSRRILEFKNSGFDRILLSEGDKREAEVSGFEGEIIAVKNISEAIDIIY